MIAALMQPKSLYISIILLYLCLLLVLCSGVMSNQITFQTQIQTFLDFLKEAAYLKPSTPSINIIIEYVVESNTSEVQQIIDDLILYSNFMVYNLNGTQTQKCNSKIFKKMMQKNCEDSIIEIMVHSECYPYNNTQFYILFLLFSRNTFSTFTMLQRITCYKYIEEQFDELEDVIDDIDEYNENENNSTIIDEMKLSISDSNEFVLEWQKAIKQSKQSLDTLIASRHHNSVPKDEYKEYQHTYDEIDCKDIVSEMIQIETENMLYFDDNAQNITKLMSKTNPDIFLDLHAVLTRHIMNGYIHDIEHEWNAIISKEMCLFIMETYFDKNKSVKYENVNIGKLMRRHLPHSPLLHIMINNNSDTVHKLNAKDVNLKLIQYIQFVSSYGITTLKNILSQQEGSNIIHLDLLFVFNKKIWKTINNIFLTKKSNNFFVKSKKKKK
eukprot:84446_1